MKIEESDISKPIKDYILQSEDPGKLIYELSQDPEKYEELRQMSPNEATRELSKIENGDSNQFPNESQIMALVILFIAAAVAGWVSGFALLVLNINTPVGM